MSDKKAENFKFFKHTECEFFPCHKGVPVEEFNCLFCYCPLYFLGDDCGGTFTYTKSGKKNCTDCTLPHIKDNYDKVIEIFKSAGGCICDGPKSDCAREK